MRRIHVDLRKRRRQRGGAGVEEEGESLCCSFCETSQLLLLLETEQTIHPRELFANNLARESARAKREETVLISRKMGKFVVRDTPTVSDTKEDCSLHSSDIPSDVIFPDQLNRYLRDQINSLSFENGGLRKSLEEMQEELTTLREKVSRSMHSLPGGRLAEMAEYKIAQLSKRLREQNAEMESLRTQTREAEAKLRRLEEKVTEDVSAEREPSPSETAEKDKQIRLLTEKLQASNAKVCDFRNQYQALKQEMKLAQRVIESEIGEKCSIQDLAKENGSWRGRAQQILTLQSKVQALQDQLNNTTASDNPASTVLRQMERERRASYEETFKQLNQKTIQAEEMRKKWEAAKARNKVLENEIIQIKGRVNALLEKGSRDEHLLSTLTNQINAFEDRSKAQIQCFGRMQENVSKLQHDLEIEKTKNEQLQKALTDRESRIHRMEGQMDDLRKNVKNKTLDVESDEERSSNVADKTTVTSPGRATAETERLRLLQLLAVVNRRLDESRQQQNQVESHLRKERYKNAKLETKIARLELEKLGAMKSGRGSYSHGNNRVADSPNSTEIDISARQHIEYLEEECLALKTRIETLQMEREEDLKALSSMAEVKYSGDDRRETEHRTNLNRKKVRRSPASSVRSTNLRQSSLSSEDFRSGDKTPLHY